MQINAPTRVGPFTLTYMGDEIWSISADVNGDFQELTFTREELYDVSQIVFARRPA